MIQLTRERLTWEDVQRQCGYIAGQILSQLPHKIGIISIARGGNIPATMISQLTGIPIVHYITIKSYTAQTRGAAEIECPEELFKYSGDWLKDFLFVEDIIDTGNSLLELHKYLVLEDGEKLDVVALVAKPQGISNTLNVINLPVQAGVKMVSQNVWVDFPWEPALKQPQRKGSKHGA